LNVVTRQCSPLISDESIAKLGGSGRRKLRDALAKVLALPAGTFDDAATVAPKVREAMKARKSYLDTGVLFGEAATEKAIEVLGDKSEDPSLGRLEQRVAITYRRIRP
jgi:hypothetical protein